MRNKMRNSLEYCENLQLGKLATDRPVRLIFKHYVIIFWTFHILPLLRNILWQQWLHAYFFRSLHAVSVFSHEKHSHSEDLIHITKYFLKSSLFIFHYTTCAVWFISPSYLFSYSQWTVCLLSISCKPFPFILLGCLSRASSDLSVTALIYIHLISTHFLNTLPSLVLPDYFWSFLVTVFNHSDAFFHFFPSERSIVYIHTNAAFLQIMFVFLHNSVSPNFLMVTLSISQLYIHFLKKRKIISLPKNLSSCFY